MASVKSCKQCGKEFEGRKNKIFCSLKCKSIANNEKDLLLRKTTRRDYAVMERNARIINSYMKSINMDRVSVLKSALIDQGFDIHGPFKLHFETENQPLYHVGDYWLKDLSKSYIITNAH